MQVAMNITQKGKSRERPTLERALRLLFSYKKPVLIAYTSLLLATSAQLAVPQLVQNMIDTLSSSLAIAGTHSMANGRQAIAWAAFLMVLFAIIRALFAFSQNFNAEKISQQIAYDLRNDVYARIQRMSFSYHDRHHTGQLMIRATDDVEKVRQFIGQGLMTTVQAIILMVASLIILALTDSHLTLIILPLLPLAVITFLLFGRHIEPLFVEVQNRLSTMNSLLQENLSGMQVVKAFTAEARQQERFAQTADRFMQQHIHVIRCIAFLTPLIFLLSNLGQSMVLYIGGKHILAGSLSLGQWQKFSLYLVYVFYPLSQLGMLISQISQAGASCGRIFEILDSRTDIRSPEGALMLPPLQGRVDFEEVTFRYLHDSPAVLEQVSFSVQPGETVALLGATGSGKSTITNLIARFYDVNSGSVRVDGYDVRSVELDSLRRQIGIVLQQSALFSGSIRDNIAFGNSAASFEAVQAAARAARAHDFIQKQPEGYDTIISERGASLSGGQKQRIAIARALLMNPRILILDDATSSVDAETEKNIQQALSALMTGRTCFIIAQRISTVRSADQILVLENGRIAARGKHAALVEESPSYAEIYHSQLFDDTECRSNDNQGAAKC